MTGALKTSSSAACRPRVSARKISAVRRRDFRCARRAIPPLNELKRERDSIAEAERALMGALLADDETRRRQRALDGEIGHPTSVWTDCDHTWDHTKLGSGLIDYSQKMTVAAMQIADRKVCAHRS